MLHEIVPCLQGALGMHEAPALHCAPPQTLGVWYPHVSVPVHDPQVAVRAAPQLSVLVTALQFFPSRPQNWTSLSGTQHVPQSTLRSFPQLSAPLRAPQVFPSRWQNLWSVSEVQKAHPLVIGSQP